MKTSNKILLILAVFLFSFVVTMIVLYCVVGSIPDTLVTCVFAVTGGECGAMAWIKTTKDRHLERHFELEDRNMKEDMKDE